MRITLCSLLLVSLWAAAPARRQPPPPTRQTRVLVEAVEIEGHRRLKDEEVLKHIRVRPGDPYDERQALRDLQSLYDLGIFDPASTRMRVEDGPRGGKVVIFRVFELPLVDELKVEGLPRGLYEADVLRAARAKGRGLRRGAACDPAAVRRGLDGVRALLAARGLSDTEVGWRASEISLGHISVVVELSEGRSF
jgi:outer membrane protein assembly factor BamA